MTKEKKKNLVFFVLFCIAVLFLAITIFRTEKIKNSDDMAKVNYAVGVIKQGTLHPDLFVAFIHDVVSWGNITLQDAHLTEEKLRRLEAESWEKYEARQKEGERACAVCHAGPKIQCQPKGRRPQDD